MIEFVQFSFSKFAQKGQHLGYRYEKLEIINQEIICNVHHMSQSKPINFFN
jgi:hypothetical protein